MRWLTTILPAFALFIVLCEGVSAQVELQEVVATVRDSQGKLVSGLRAEDFIVELKDGSPTIVSFEANPRTPMSIGLLIDRRAYMFMDTGGPVPGVNAAAGLARMFMRSFSRPRDEVMLSEIQSSFRVVEGFTEDSTKIDSALRMLYAQDTNSNLRRKMMGVFGSVVQALDEMKRSRHANRILVVVTDGTSSDSFSTFAAEIRAREIPIYWIGIDAREGYVSEGMHVRNRDGQFDVARPGDQEAMSAEGRAGINNFFSRLAEDTGGRAEIIAPNIQANIVERVLAFSMEASVALRGQYRLGFYGQGLDLQTIRVRTNVPDHRVQIRRIPRSPTQHQ